MEPLQTERFSKSKIWKKLIYFKNNKSEINSPNFILSPKKKFDANNELQLNINKLLSSIKSPDVIESNRYECSFPARTFVLNKALNLKINVFELFTRCPKLNDFLSRTIAKSVSLVFSSYYVSNPSSAFGHTLLKLNRNADSNLDLLNYGINYSATADINSGIIYSIKGMIGLLPGNFSVIPYYYKVQEYNNYESRDLWEYELNLTPEEVILFNLHLWELGPSWSWYYFLDRNCSYWALKIIEAIKPELSLTSKLDSTFVMPAETIKILVNQPNLIKKISYRPSLRNQLLTNRTLLSKDRFKQIKKYVNNISKDKKDNLVTSDPLELDTAILYYDYLNAGKYLTEEKEFLKRKSNLLLQRSQAKSQPVKNSTSVNSSTAPHFTHPFRNLKLSYKNQNAKNLDEMSGVFLNYKAGFHDLLDPTLGFNSNMGLNFLDLAIQIKNTSKSDLPNLRFDYLKLLSVQAFNPYDDLEQKLSWRLNISFDSDHIYKSWYKKSFLANFDLGVSKNFFSEFLLMYFMGTTTLEANGRINNLIRPSTGPLIGLKIQLNTLSALQMETKYLYFLNQDNNLDSVLQTYFKFNHYIKYLETAVSTGFESIHIDSRNVYTITMSLNYYF